jgi:hypothetical protein
MGVIVLFKKCVQHSGIGITILFQNKKIMKQKYSALENREIANPTNLK